MEVFRIYGIFLVLLVRVGNIADKDKRSLHLLAVFIMKNPFAPGQYRALMKTDIMIVRIMGRDDIGQYYNTERVIRGGMLHLEIAHSKAQGVFIGVPDLDHFLSSLDELPISRAVPKGILVHIRQKRHIVILIISDDEFCGKICNSLYVHIITPCIV